MLLGGCQGIANQTVAWVSWVVIGILIGGCQSTAGQAAIGVVNGC